MAFVKGKSGNAKGRPPGSPNKTTTAVKEALGFAYEGIGGNERFRDWAHENPTDFYKLFAKQLPLEVHGNVSGEFIVKIGKDASRVA